MADDDDDKGLNPRAALMAMFNKRGGAGNGSSSYDNDNSPPPTAQNSEVSTPDKDNYDGEGDDGNDAQQHSDSKIALSTLLAKRGGGGNGKKSTPAHNNNDDDAENDTEDTDPRNALSAMFAKRGGIGEGRGSKIQLLSPSKVKQSSSMEREEEEEKKETMDPRASLMAMLNKRGAPQSINDSSQQQKQNDISTPSRNEKQTVDPRSSLMAMLNKRGAPQSSINDSSQQQQNKIASNEKISSSSREEEETVDPRASLMAMLNKRGGGGAPASQQLHSSNNHVRENNNSKNAPQQQETIEPSSSGRSDVGKPALKNDPKYEKYFKMIKVGMPLPVVQHAMTRDGFDASVMEGDHNMTEDGLEPISDIVGSTHNKNTVPIPESSIPNNSTDDGIVVFDRDGLSGHGLLAIEDDNLTDLPLVNGSGIRVQRGKTYYTSETCKCGIRECSAPCQTVIRPYPHNEFTIILEGSVIIINDSFTEMTFRAGDAFIIPKGAYVSWKHIMTVRRLYVIIIDGEGEVGPLESLSVRRVEYPLTNKRFIPKVVYANRNGQLMVGLTNMIEFTNIYEFCQDNNNNKLLGSCRYPNKKEICKDTTEKGGRLIVSYPFRRNELLHIVEGSLKINTRMFVVGDTFLVPRGTICQWDSTGVVRVMFCSWHSSVGKKDIICKAITNNDEVSQVPTPSNVDSSNAGRPALKDDPKYTKYFKMLKIGMPIDVVKHAMTRDGFDPTIMDGDHNVPLKS